MSCLCERTNGGLWRVSLYTTESCVSHANTSFSVVTDKPSVYKVKTVITIITMNNILDLRHKDQNFAEAFSLLTLITLERDYLYYLIYI